VDGGRGPRLAGSGVGLIKTTPQSLRSRVLPAIEGRADLIALVAICALTAEMLEEEDLVFYHGYVYRVEGGV
jgi:hypothetical protein